MSDRKDAVVRHTTCMQIWATGDPSTADAIMAEDVRNVDLLFAHETSGRAEFKSMIHSVFKVGSMLCSYVSSPLSGHSLSVHFLSRSQACSL